MWSFDSGPWNTLLSEIGRQKEVEVFPTMKPISILSIRAICTNRQSAARSWGQPDKEVAMPLIRVLLKKLSRKADHHPDIRPPQNVVKNVPSTSSYFGT